MILSSFILEHV